MSKKKLSLLSEPQTVQRLFHGKTITLSYGRVRLSDVQGWANNPRLELEMKKWKSDFADAPIDQNALYDMMKNTDHVRLKKLADDISANGMREPIVLTFDGDLLDGNRRFFAAKFAYETAKDRAKKLELETIPVFVMLKDATEQDKHHILVEENFSPSLKEEWPDYVKARFIRKELEEGHDPADVAERFGWPRTKVMDTKKIGEITDNFIAYAMGDPESDEGGLGKTEIEAEQIASKEYQMFNEAKKSFRVHLRDNPDFAELFYKLIAKGDVFTRWDEARYAYRGYEHADGRPILEEGKAGAGKRVKALIQHEDAGIKKRVQTQETIEEFVKFLDGLSTDQKREISDASLGKLREALVLVDKLVRAAKQEE